MANKIDITEAGLDTGEVLPIDSKKIDRIEGTLTKPLLIRKGVSVNYLELTDIRLNPKQGLTLFFSNAGSVSVYTNGIIPDIVSLGLAKLAEDGLAELEDKLK